MKSIKKQIINMFKIPFKYLHLKKEVKELLGPALKENKIIYLNEEMEFYHFIEILISKSYKLNAVISINKTGVDVKVIDLEILVKIIFETDQSEKLFKLTEKELNSFMNELNSKINYIDKLKIYINRDIRTGRSKIENDFKRMINKFEADHGLSMKKVLMGALGVPWHKNKYEVFKRIRT